MSLLKLQKLTKLFAGLTAVNGLDVSVNEGEIVGLIGPNGAGKTTVFNMISGVLRPTRGNVIFKDDDITGLKPYSIVKKGLARTFQLPTLFNEMTVLDNVLLGLHPRARIGYLGSLFNTSYTRDRQKELLDEAEEIINLTGLTEKKYDLARNLPHGTQRALEIAIALATEPDLLLLDEPFTGLNTDEARTMMNKIQSIHEKGITILLVEHDMRVVMNICQRIYVLNFGLKIAEGCPNEICANQEVINAYLGSEYAA